MGAVIKRKDFPKVIEQVQQCLFVMSNKVTFPANVTFVNIGLLLSERMLSAKLDGSRVSIVNELDTILEEKNSDIALVNIDILFSPEYKLDVIRLLLQVGRNQRLYIKWPGNSIGEKLTYSEPGRFDYKEYDIKNYVDTYIVLR